MGMRRTQLLAALALALLVGLAMSSPPATAETLINTQVGAAMLNYPTDGGCGGLTATLTSPTAVNGTGLAPTQTAPGGHRDDRTTLTSTSDAIDITTVLISTASTSGPAKGHGKANNNNNAPAITATANTAMSTLTASGGRRDKTVIAGGSGSGGVTAIGTTSSRRPGEDVTAH